MDVKVSRVEEDRIAIPITVYNEMVRKSEKIAAVERLLKKNNYITTEDVAAILDIPMS